MVEIIISGYTVLVDDDDLDRIKERHWYMNQAQYRQMRKHYFYNDRVIDKKKHSITLHRFIMGCTIGDGWTIDHISGNTLDCRKSNLRKCFTIENARNQQKRENNSSGYKGVQWSKPTKKWQARVNGVNGQYLGLYNTAEEAARVYDIAALHLFKEFACTNFPKETYIDINIEEEYNKYIPQFSTNYIGVCESRGRYDAYFNHNKHRYHLGTFSTPIEAAIARDAKAFELLKEKARLNFPERVVAGVYNKEKRCN